MKRILVIEDDEMLNAGLCYNLQMEGFEAAPAFGAKTAKKLWKVHDQTVAIRKKEGEMIYGSMGSSGFACAGLWRGRNSAPYRAGR